jgi:2-keto-myo-inositol isomerase
VFRLVHDTFHHRLAGEAEIFPELTGLVHISGVIASLGIEALRDGHRVLVTEADLMGNIEQVRALIAGGYDGFLSFEPFAAEVQDLAEPAGAIRRSIELVREGATVAAV